MWGQRYWQRHASATGGLALCIRTSPGNNNSIRRCCVFFFLLFFHCALRERSAGLIYFLKKNQPGDSKKWNRLALANANTTHVPPPRHYPLLRRWLFTPSCSTCCFPSTTTLLLRGGRQVNKNRMQKEYSSSSGNFFSRSTNAPA